MWFRKKQQQPPTRTTNFSGSAEFEEAARRSVEQARRDVADVTADMRAEVGEGEETAFEVDAEFSEEAARLCFLPLAKYDHPAWELDDAEAQKLGPRFERLFQAVADRYLPAVMFRLAARHPEAFNLGVVLAVMYWKKYRVVSKVKASEAKAEAARPGPQAVPAKQPTPITSEASEEKFNCELCGVNFPSFEALSAHLPCKGKSGQSVQ